MVLDIGILKDIFLKFYKDNIMDINIHFQNETVRGWWLYVPNVGDRKLLVDTADENGRYYKAHWYNIIEKTIDNKDIWVELVEG